MVTGTHRDEGIGVDKRPSASLEDTVRAPGPDERDHDKDTVADERNFL